MRFARVPVEITFSIVTPTYNRPSQLARYLESLTHLDYPKERFEVMLVDDGSDVDVGEVVNRFRGQLQLQFLRRSHGGIAQARGAGAVLARGRYLAFTDDDCMPAPDWLRRLEEALQGGDGSAAGGRTVNALTANPYSEASQAVIRYLYERLNERSAGPVFFTGNNSAFPRQQYLELGGLDGSFLACGEDRDLCARWRERGYGLIYVPEAVVRHAHPMGFGGFWRKHFQYGRGARWYHRTLLARQSSETRFETLSFYLRLPLAAFRYYRGGRALLICVLVLVSQIAHTIGYAIEWVRPTKESPRCLPEKAL